MRMNTVVAAKFAAQSTGFRIQLLASWQPFCYTGCLRFSWKFLRFWPRQNRFQNTEQERHLQVGTKKTGKGRRKIGRKKRRMRAKIRHRKK